MVKCSLCEKYFKYEEEGALVGGLYYCNECYEEAFTTCEHCGREMRRDEAYSVLGSEGYFEEWCPTCRWHHATRCEDCEELVSDDYSRWVRNHGRVCDGCLERYYYCNECYEYYTEEDYNFDADACVFCRPREEDDRILEHWSKLEPVFFGRQKNKKCLPLYFGLELEVDSGEDTCPNSSDAIDATLEHFPREVYFERDGSLSDGGVEMVFFPMTEGYLLSRDWEALFERLKATGWRSENAVSSCGLHVHISRQGLGRTTQRQDDAVAKLSYFMTTYFEDFVKISRRHRYQLEWCEDLGRYASSKSSAKNYAKRKGLINRYHTINNNNEKTIEIRLLRGTLNYNTFIASLKLLIHLVKRSKRISWKKATSVEEWIKGIDGDVIEYLRRRDAFSNFINQ